MDSEIGLSQGTRRDATQRFEDFPGENPSRGSIERWGREAMSKMTTPPSPPESDDEDMPGLVGDSSADEDTGCYCTSLGGSPEHAFAANVVGPHEAVSWCVRRDGNGQGRAPAAST